MRTLICLLFMVPGIAMAQNPLQNIISSNPFLKELSKDRSKHQIQIVYTRIDRDKNNQPTFRSFEWGLQETEYYYPASTVKMPAAFLALEKLNQLNILGLDAQSPLKVGAAREPQVPVTGDSTSSDGAATIAHYIKKIFLVSDNDAYNRLYEFIGQEQFTSRLHEKGYKDTRILHRLGPEGFPFSFDDNQYTNPISFYKGDELIYHQGEVLSQIAAANKVVTKNEQLGVAHINKAGELVNAPFDFSVKNFFSLRDMHDVLKAVMFPEQTPAHRRFDLNDEDYQFLYKWMSTFPAESGIEAYKEKEDNYVKFFIYGDQEQGDLPPAIKIFNKVGWAYGFLTDVSYIIDRESKIEFFLAATIKVNENDTYNDGVYEYETIGMPFFGHLGRAIYQYETTRKRSYPSDFSRLGY
ncbi:MAG: serine hydrolase [Cytophagales bacterium]|nr:serine hydrolase [Cytophagales bacterium]